MASNNSPVSLRVQGEDRRMLDALSVDSSVTDVLLAGLRQQAQAKAPPGTPLYARRVDDEDVQLAVENAARAACEVLDQLFPDCPSESAGICSNFQGMLVEHLQAMLTGKPSASWSHQRNLTALLGDWGSLGRGLRAAGRLEGYTVMALPLHVGDETTFYHSDLRKLVPLARVSAASLFTSEEAAAKEVFAWLRDNGLSPRDQPMKLCLLSWDQDEGLHVAAVAS